MAEGIDTVLTRVDAATLLDRALGEVVHLVDMAGALGAPAAADVARRLQTIDAATVLALPAGQAAGLLRRLCGDVERLAAMLAAYGGSGLRT